MKILKNIRVLDFGRYIAGPYCGALLGDLGAEVIRIERLDGSEDRFIHPLKDEGGEGAMFMQMNRNKKCDYQINWASCFVKCCIKLL